MVRQVYILASAEAGSRRRMVEGILRHARDRYDWRVTYHPGTDDPSQLLSRRVWDGAIVASTFGMHHWLGTVNCPVVVCGEPTPPFPSVWPDESAVVRTGYAHLRQKGLSEFAWFGIKGAPFAVERGRHIAELTRADGLPLHVYARNVYADMREHPHEVQALLSFLRTIPRPCGAMCATTEIAVQLIDFCHDLGINVPDELAVMGIDDDEFLAQLSRPQVSVVDQHCERMGALAAETLEALMSGRPAPALPPVPPVGVIERESTDVQHCDDGELLSTLSRIHAGIAEGLRVEDLVRHASVSRRTLERRFQDRFGQSIARYAMRCRLNRARTLLRETDAPLREVAARCGFSHATKFHAAFRRETGQTPGVYRASFRGG